MHHHDGIEHFKSLFFTYTYLEFSIVFIKFSTWCTKWNKSFLSSKKKQIIDFYRNCSRRFPLEKLMQLKLHRWFHTINYSFLYIMKISITIRFTLLLNGFSWAIFKWNSFFDLWNNNRRLFGCNQFPLKCE